MKKIVCSFLILLLILVPAGSSFAAAIEENRTPTTAFFYTEPEDDAFSSSEEDSIPEASTGKEENGPVDRTEDSMSSSDTSHLNRPQTGDTKEMLFWQITAVISAVGCVIALLLAKAPSKE